ncbi:MAG: ribonuclease P protein component [Bacteroidales bacterium]|nr:ribonuclease P protein component [Bacteroidales bacterium]MDE6307977.1 ribonuclease P protein component [Bacteroidales bacterium]
MPALGKAERLYRQRTVSALFARGRRYRISGGAYMLKVCALWCDPAGLDERPAPVKVMFSAPKSSFKHAVDRNRFKRLMRESFRARKAQWTALAEAGASAEGASVLLVAFIFTKIGKTPDGFVLKQPDMQVYIDRAAEKLAKIAGGAR